MIDIQYVIRNCYFSKKYPLPFIVRKSVHIGTCMFLQLLLLHSACNKDNSAPSNTFKVIINNNNFLPVLQSAAVHTPNGTTTSNLYITAQDSAHKQGISIILYGYTGITGTFSYPIQTPHTFLEMAYTNVLGKHIATKYGQMKLSESDDKHIKGTFSFTSTDSTKLDDGEFYLNF